MKTSRGFTIVELMVVAILGTIMVIAAYQVLITNRRVFTVQNSRVGAQQVTRSSMDVLSFELREVSSLGSDVVALGPDSISVRAMRKIGMVCDPANATHLTTPELSVRADPPFEVDDSVYVFADNDEFATDDDEWFRARITNVNPTVCPDGATGQRLTFAGQSTAFQADSVSAGAPLRSFIHMTYGLGDYGGDTYLGRVERGASWVPIMGPLAASDGLRFGYLDGAGAITATPADVRQIEVTVRSAADARSSDGTIVADSLSTRIFLRN